MLYNRVFSYSLEDIDEMLEAMLKDKYFSKLKNQRRRRGLPKEGALASQPPDAKQLPPIPYKVAKALDCTMYRNVEIDRWLIANMDELAKSMKLLFTRGTHCMLTKSSAGRPLYGYIQELIGEKLRFFSYEQHAA